MAAPLGHKKAGGRQKGTTNKSISDLRSIFSTLLINNEGNMQTWIDKLAQRNPGKALEIITKMADYLIPKPIQEGEKSPELDWYAEQARKMMEKSKTG